jgi:hypothetical protein
MKLILSFSIVMLLALFGLSRVALAQTCGPDNFVDACVSVVNTGVGGTSTYAVFGWDDSNGAIGVYGQSTNNIGVYGVSAGGTQNVTGFYGVYGSSDSGDAVLGAYASTSAGANGVKGTSASSSTTSSGVYGENTGSGYGVRGSTNGTASTSYGMYGSANGGNSFAIYGDAPGRAHQTSGDSTCEDALEI